MTTMRKIVATLLLSLAAAAAQEITPPEKFFGFQLGADKKMARWDKIVEYYGVLEKQSGGRMKVVNMGPTSERQSVPAGVHHVGREHGEARALPRSQPAASAIRAG